MQIGDDGYVKGKKITLNKNLIKVMGYIFFIVGVIELVLSIFYIRNYWLDVIKDLSIGIALLIGSYEVENKILNYLQLPLSIVCLLCIFVEWIR